MREQVSVLEGSWEKINNEAAFGGDLTTKTTEDLHKAHREEDFVFFVLYFLRALCGKSFAIVNMKFKTVKKNPPV